MNQQLKTILPLAALAGLGLSGTASAALAAVDFNAGGADTGFANAWNGWGGSSSVKPEATGDLTYANYGIVQTGTGGKYYNTADHPDRMDSSVLSSSMSGDVWFSILVNVEAGADFAGISFHSVAPSPAYSHNTSDMRVVLTTSELWVDWNGGGLNAAWTPDATVGGLGITAGTHLLLGKMTVGVGPDSIDVWVDPDVNAAGSPGGLGAADYSDATTDFMDSIVAIGMPGDKGTTAGGKVYNDAIRLSNNADAFADVTGVVPEPSTTALLGLGGLALILRRRK